MASGGAGGKGERKPSFAVSADFCGASSPIRADLGLPVGQH